MRTYEAVCVFRPEEEAFSAGRDAVRAELENLGANITKEEDMGRRTLAYPIRKMNQGHYYLFVTEMDPASVQQTEDQLKLKVDMLRFLLVRRED
ncbi:MAG: 30S ribosomal protein S6 [Spirochaetaceae bacterium]